MNGQLAQYVRIVRIVLTVGINWYLDFLRKVKVCVGYLLWSIYKKATIIGRFACKGYDTFGPFKLVGGIARGHPDDKDLADAVAFFKGLE